MSVFKALLINKMNINDDTLILSENDTVYHIFDENDLPTSVTKVILKSSKDIDFVVVLRQNKSSLPMNLRHIRAEK